MRKPVFLLLFLLLPSLAHGQNKIAARPLGQVCYNAGGTGGCLAFSATPTFDAGVANNFKITLTANVTSSTMVGLETGQHPIIEVCQDGVGGRTFAFPSQFAGQITVLAGVNACIAELFYYDGTTASIITTTTAGGGGSGTITSGTGKCFTWFATTGTTVAADCNLDDGLTNALALTYLGANGVFANSFNGTSSGAGLIGGTNSTCSGAAVGKSIICAGDLISGTVQISNGGDSFRTVLTSLSTSPVPHGVLVGAPTFPQVVALSRGTQGQALLEGATGGDPGFGQFDLSVATNVINRLAKANQTASTIYNDQVNTATAAGTMDFSASTVSNAFRVPIGPGLTTTLNGAHGYDTTSNNHHLGTNGADSRIVIWTGSAPVHHDCVWWTNVSGHVEVGDSLTTCGGGSTPRLDQVTSATNPWSTTNGDNPLSLQFAATTSGRTSVEITESAAGTSGGTPFLLNVHTLAASTLNPCNFTARGTANGIRCDAVTGTLSAIGTANINSTQINGVAVTGTPAVGQVPIASSSTAAAWGDPITSGNQAAATTQTITTTGALTGVTVTNIGTVLVTVSGTYAGVAFNFEATPDGTFSPAFPVAASQLDANSILFNTGALPSNTTRSWLVDAAGFTKIRVNATAYTSGTANITVTPVYHQFVPWTNANIAAIAAGSSIIGKVGIDQTTPGTTNAVSETNLPTVVDTNSGNKSASTLRFVLATDQPALTNKLLVTPDSVALPANQSVNVNQKAGSALVADPCETQAKVYDSFSGTVNTQLITGTSAKKIYFCSFSILVGAATNVAVVEGTGTVCATGIAKFPGLSGGTTAAGGWNFAANGGLTFGNGGSSIAAETTNADNVCVLVSAANQTNISYSYVVQ